MKQVLAYIEMAQSGIDLLLIDRKLRNGTENGDLQELENINLLLLETINLLNLERRTNASTNK